MDHIETKTTNAEKKTDTDRSSRRHGPGSDQRIRGFGQRYRAAAAPGRIPDSDDTDIAVPTTVRRTVAFSPAVYQGPHAGGRCDWCAV